MIEFVFNMDILIWSIGSLFFDAFLFFLLFIIYKVTSKEFHKFTKKRVIASIIIFSVPFLVDAISMYNDRSWQSEVDAYNNFQVKFLFSIVYLITAILYFFAVFVLVCSIVSIYRKFFKREFKKNRRDFILSWISIAIFNNFTLAFVSLIFLIVTSAFMYPRLYQECGAVVGGFTSDSAALEAGIRVNDTIIQVNDYNISSTKDLRNALNSIKPNERARVITDSGIYYPTLKVNPNNTSRSVIGIFGKPKFCKRQ